MTTDAGVAQRKATARQQGGLRILLFGSFYPRTDRLATTTTGLLLLLANSPLVSEVKCVVPRGALCPDGVPAHVHLDQVWDYDDIRSLFHALREILRVRNGHDVLLFNILLTSFGKRRLSNLIGLCIPIVAGLLVRKRAVVYLHNLVEAQSVKKLGYDASRISLIGIRAVERILAIVCRLVVPLSSQREAFNPMFRDCVDTLFVPHLEGIFGWSLIRDAFMKDRRKSIDGRKRLLLFGAWGPQKDLGGFLNVLLGANQEFEDIDIMIAGETNSNFPSHALVYSSLKARYSSSHVSFLGAVSERELAELLVSADLLVLPYNATGGYSAVMSVGSLYGVPMVAYDQAELRETARLVGARVSFIAQSDLDKIGSLIMRVLKPKTPPPPPSVDDISTKVLASTEVLDRFLAGIPRR